MDEEMCAKVRRNCASRITPVDTKWVDTDKAFEGEPMQIRSRICAREYAGTPPLEAFTAIISIAANNKETFSIMHIDVSRAYFHAKAQRPVLIRLPVEDRKGTDVRNVGLMKKSMYGKRDAASNWERDWQEHVENWGFQLGLSSKNLLIDRIRGEADESVSHQSEGHRLWVVKEYQ